MTPKQAAMIQRIKRIASDYCGTVYAPLVWGEAEELVGNAVLIQGSNSQACPWYDKAICITVAIGPKGAIRKYPRFDNIPAALFS